MKKIVFSTGMFRSGTTLVARMLNSHPEIAFASDPYAFLFKSFRNAVEEKYLDTEEIDYDAPLDDYYFYHQKQKIMNFIQNESFNLPFNKTKIASLRNTIAKLSEPYSPKIKFFLDELEGETFKELFAKGMDIINNAYGSNQTKIIGFKEVWAGEFAKHILESFPEAKVIHIVRDPRAVCASKNVTNEKYPWLFLIRQWRKLASFAWIDAHSLYKDRVHLLKYEDLVKEPLIEVKKLCSFLEINFNSNLSDPTTFVDGTGKKWKQNSTHFQGKQKFNQDSINKWQELLKPEEIQLIESLCIPEMRIFGYKITNKKNEKLNFNQIFNSKEMKFNELAEWIKPYSCLDNDKWLYEMSLEYMRSQVLKSQESVSKKIKQSLSLNSKFFKKLRDLQKD